MVNYNAAEDPTLSAQKCMESIWRDLDNDSKFSSRIFPTVDDANAWVASQSGKLNILVTGSLHLVGAMMNILEVDVA